MQRQSHTTCIYSVYYIFWVALLFPNFLIIPGTCNYNSPICISKHISRFFTFNHYNWGSNWSIIWHLQIGLNTVSVQFSAVFFFVNLHNNKKIRRNHNHSSSTYIPQKRISKNARQASWLSSSLPISFFSNGCFSGSLEYRQSSPGFLLRAVDNVLLRVRFGGGLQTKVICLITLNCH